jgi:multidrug efflux pump subunit AcrB
MENILRADERVKSVSAFIGTSSPRFHVVYAPNMPSKSYGQFIVNITSDKATEEMLNDYANKYAFYFPEAYVRFKQLDFQAVDAPMEIRFIGDNINDLKKEAEKTSDYLQTLDECLWVRTSFNTPTLSVGVELNQSETGHLGINKTLASLNISSGLTGIKITDLWEGNYAVPMELQPENEENTVSSPENVRVSGLIGSAGAVIAGKEGLSKESYLYAIKLLTELIDNPQPGFAMYSEIAVAYGNMGDYKSAVDAQGKAVAAAKQGLKDNKYPGFITEDTIKEYEVALEGYKAKLK